MATSFKLIPIYTSRGDLGGFLQYPYIFSPSGEWIGWVAADRRVYSVLGQLVGEISKEPRILRPREFNYTSERLTPPREPHTIRPPVSVPLAPTMPEVPSNMIDVLEEAPELLPPMGYGELTEDMD